MSTEDEACEAIGLLNGALLADRRIVVRDVTKQVANRPAPTGGCSRNKTKGGRR
jgi:hypothetical protein